jgi:hypothetical protein
MLDDRRLAHEMRLLAEERIDEIAGEGVLLLTKRDAAKICGRSQPWLDDMVATGRLPTVQIGRSACIQRPVLVEALIWGV